jgi:hypothetical protein
MYGNYSYFDRPVRSTVTNAPVQAEFNKQSAVMNSMKELYASLIQKEERSGERGHIYHNIGTMYFDMYKATRVQRAFDSSECYYLKSVDALPDNQRFRYNLGRLYKEQRRYNSK